MIDLGTYIDEVVRREYLADFIRAGGASVKVAVPLDGVSPADVHEDLRRAAKDEGYSYAYVDASEVRADKIDRVFHEIARQIDWDRHTRDVCTRAYADLGLRVPAESPITVDAVAEANRYDAVELRLELNRDLQRRILQDYELAQEFRIAVARLCQAQVDQSEYAQINRQNVLAWLTGELRPISALKQATIFQKIGRHNARHMLVSLTRWLPKAGGAGLVLDLDIRRCSTSRRPPEDQTVYYSKAATLDLYELVRQLIDGTDELRSCLVFVVVAQEFLSDPHRGVDKYKPLMTRISDEVRDRRRPNPLATLVRLAPRTTNHGDDFER
jgi:hypothetical protein